jgi:hypothetical protein
MVTATGVLVGAVERSRSEGRCWNFANWALLGCDCGALSPMATGVWSERLRTSTLKEATTIEHH